MREKTLELKEKIKELQAQIDFVANELDYPIFEKKSKFKLIRILSKFKKKKRKAIFGIFDRKTKKRAELYGYSTETFEVNTKLKSGLYFYYKGKIVNESLKDQSIHIIEIAKLLSFLIDKSLEDIKLVQTAIEKMIIEQEEKKKSKIDQLQDMKQ